MKTFDISQADLQTAGIISSLKLDRPRCIWMSTPHDTTNQFYEWYKKETTMITEDIPPTKFKVGHIVEPNDADPFLREHKYIRGTVFRVNEHSIEVLFSPSNRTMQCCPSELKLAPAPSFEAIRVTTDPKNQHMLLVKPSALDTIGRHNIQFLETHYYMAYNKHITSEWLETLAADQHAVIGARGQEQIAILLNSRHQKGEHFIRVIMNGPSSDVHYGQYTCPWMTLSYKEALIQLDERHI